MIWTVLEWINYPDGWAITYKDGGFYIEPVQSVIDMGGRIKG